MHKKNLECELSKMDGAEVIALLKTNKELFSSVKRIIKLEEIRKSVPKEDRPLN